MLPLLRLLPLALSLLIACGSESKQRPNVLLISLDSVSFDQLTPYGGKALWHPNETITPTIETLSQSGLTFDQALSTTSWTLPAHMALFTGLPDPVHGVTDNHKRLDSGIVTLAENLRAVGYQTAGFFSGPNLHPIFGFSQGFDSYHNESSTLPELSMLTDKRSGAMLPAHRASHEDVTSPALVAAASTFIAKASQSDAPFFCFVHFWDPHYDYIAPPEVEARFVRPGFVRERGGVTGTWSVDKLKRNWDKNSAADLLSLYHAELAYTDSFVGRLLAQIDALGLTEETLIVFVADHGEEFFEHGRWGHQRTLFDEVVRIPLIMRWPGHLPTGQRVPGQARIQDIFATISDLVDVPLPTYASSTTLFGESLRPLWEDPSNPGRDQILSLNVPYRNIHQVGLRSPASSDAANTSYKVLLDPATQEARLFDLEADPSEKNEIKFQDYPISSNPKIRAAFELEARLAAAKSALPLENKGDTAELSDGIRAELERLGYL